MLGIGNMQDCGRDRARDAGAVAGSSHLRGLTRGVGPGPPRRPPPTRRDRDLRTSWPRRYFASHRGVRTDGSRMHHRRTRAHRRRGPQGPAGRRDICAPLPSRRGKILTKTGQSQLKAFK